MSHSLTGDDNDPRRTGFAPAGVTEAIGARRFIDRCLETPETLRATREENAASETRHNMFPGKSGPMSSAFPS